MTELLAFIACTRRTKREETARVSALLSQSAGRNSEPKMVVGSLSCTLRLAAAASVATVQTLVARASPNHDHAAIVAGRCI